MYVAEHYLGLEVEEREVYLDEVKDFAECGLCGTAAVISPVGKIVDHGKEICFPSGMEEMGPVTKKLYETLTGIQMGHIEAPEGWSMQDLLGLRKSQAQEQSQTLHCFQIIQDSYAR